MDDVTDADVDQLRHLNSGLKIASGSHKGRLKHLGLIVFDRKTREWRLTEAGLQALSGDPQVK